MRALEFARHDLTIKQKELALTMSVNLLYQWIDVHLFYEVTKSVMREGVKKRLRIEKNEEH